MGPFTSRAAILIVLSVVLAAKATAQDLDNISITGTTSDQTGAVIAGAQLVATSLETSLARNTITDARGRYRFAQLPPGNYRLEASFSGFATATKHTQKLLAGDCETVDFTLLPADVISPSVVVTANVSQGIDTARTVVGGTLDRRELESLPLNTRSALDVVFTLPGVTEEPLTTRDLAEDRNTNHATTPEEAGRFALGGGPAYSNNLTIDGLDNNDDRSARERFEPSLEAIDEVQVISNQFAAEYGRASGGRVNLRTRGGTNSFHGRGYYFFRDEALNANTFRNNTLGLKRVPVQQHTPGFSFSGPAFHRRQNKAFFFFSYEYDTFLDHAVIDTLLPVRKNALFPLPAPNRINRARAEEANAPALSTEVAPYVAVVNTPSRNHKLTARIDEQFSERHDGSLILHLGRLKNLRQFSGGNRLAETLLPQTRNSDSLSYSDNLVVSSTVLNQARLQFSRLRPALKPILGGPVVLITINDSLEASDPAHRSGTVVTGSSNASATDRREDRFQAQETLMLVKGSHSVKAGVDLQKITSTFIDLSGASGTYTFSSAGDFVASTPNRFRQNFLTESSQRNTYLAFFMQDEWRIREGLLITYGLRYERESILADTNNFGPRFALAYDPFHKGNTVFRIGAGLFYNRALLRTVDDFTLGNQQLFFDTNTLRDDAGRLLSADARRAFIASNLKFPATLAVDSPLVKQFAVRNTAFARRLDPHLRIPESYQGNFGLEHYLGNGFVLAANLTLNRGIHLWREFNANAPVLPSGYHNFSAYLISRDFPNFRIGSTGLRPLYNASSAGELVRFTLTPVDPANPNAVVRVSESGLPLSVINLNSVSSNTAIEVALAALNPLRPDPTRAEVEQLVSAGNSFYHALTLELRQRSLNLGSGRASFRAAYTLSRLMDDGVLNTSDAIVPGAFQLERARSLLDRRHRFLFAGTFDLPGLLSKLRVAPVLRIASGAPFNISLGGTDRNLDDVSNDRPVFNGDPRLLRWRRPGTVIPPSLFESFASPTIGTTGNLPRNAGTSPGLFLFDLNVSREFRLGDHVRVRPTIEFDNVLNRTVFSFGSEFINFSAVSPNAGSKQRQAFSDAFLVPTRTLRHREISVGLRVEF